MVGNPFDTSVSEYDRWFEVNRRTYLSELAALKGTLPPGLSLEVGVGSGRFAARLGVTVGLDISLPMLVKARERGLPVVRGKAEALPFRDGVFDGVLLVTVLCFLQNPSSVLKETSRVIRPGGRLVLAILDRASPLGMELRKKAAGSRFYQGARFLSAQEVIGMVETLGFKVEALRQTVIGGVNGGNYPEPVLEGHGKGLFVVIMASKG
jgi:ubiquinone/menaquinone biosynthesis C-methylase UbiE